ncbi:MAG: NAD-binding protein, partial [Acidimicrobiia bacterium]
MGCGRVGSELAGALESTGHSVAVVDKRASSFRRLPATFTGERVVGFGFDRDDLAAAGIDRGDAVGAVTRGCSGTACPFPLFSRFFGKGSISASPGWIRCTMPELSITSTAAPSWPRSTISRILPETTSPSRNLTVTCWPA